MNMVLKIGLVLVLMMVLPCLGNPIPPYQIGLIKASPPQVGIINYYSSDIDVSGMTIVTSRGIATIDSGTIIPRNWPTGQPYILDSTNTSGLAFNQKGDSIIANLLPYYSNEIKFGQLGTAPVPIDGYALIFYPDPLYLYWGYISFDFARPNYGYTSVLINEVNAGSTWDRCGNFIELYNKSAVPISLNGWRLVCDTIYDFPANAIIPAHGYYVVDECDFPTKFHMNFDGDNLYLINHDTLVDQVGWSSDHGANVSFMRYPDGDVDTSIWIGMDFIGFDDNSSTSFENGFPSRGAANRHENPGFVVIAARADSTGLNAARLTWTNPIWDPNIAAAVVVRSTNGFVNNPPEGEVIYEGRGQIYIDPNLAFNQVYYYTIFARKYDNSYSIPTSESQASIILHSAGIAENSNLPTDFHISCYPNPFNARTLITFTLPVSERARVAIYDVAGRLVDIAADRAFEAGQNSVLWDAVNRPSGVYFYSIKTDTGSQTKTVVLMK
jgi:hypothetical protein